MVSIGLSQDTSTTGSGLRPVNLRTDLAPLADLIELAFADTMDSSGRAALREMRMLSRIGVGLNVLSRLNDLSLGINMGYVWFEHDRLVGNVSIYPARWHHDLGSAWIIANVGVHPDYRRRGIARRLMEASLALIASRGGDHSILQVDYDNERARQLYRSLGFLEERAWSLWRRSAGSRPPALNPEAETMAINHPRRSEWQAEYALAQRVRPASLGGIGWLRPLHPSLFRPGLFQWLDNLFNLRGTERLVLRSEANHLHGSLWIESGFATSTRLTLLVEPDHAGTDARALLGNAVRRYSSLPMMIEHPHDEPEVSAVLEQFRFIRQRTVIHMRKPMHSP